MSKLSLEELPAAVSELTEEFMELKIFLHNHFNQSQVEQDRWLSLQEFRAYHPDKPAYSTIYGWTSNRTVPFHKHGKKLRFLKSEIDSWLMTGRNKTSGEITDEAETYLAGKGKGKL